MHVSFDYYENPDYSFIEAIYGSGQKKTKQEIRFNLMACCINLKVSKTSGNARSTYTPVILYDSDLYGNLALKKYYLNSDSGLKKIDRKSVIQNIHRFEKNIETIIKIELDAKSKQSFNYQFNGFVEKYRNYTSPLTSVLSDLSDNKSIKLNEGIKDLLLCLEKFELKESHQLSFLDWKVSNDHRNRFEEFLAQFSFKHNIGPIKILDNLVKSKTENTLFHRDYLPPDIPIWPLNFKIINQ